MFRAIALVLLMVSVAHGADHVLFNLEAPFSVGQNNSYNFTFSTGDGGSLNEIFTIDGGESFTVAADSSPKINRLTADLLGTEPKDNVSFVLNGSFVPVPLSVDLSHNHISAYEVSNGGISHVDGFANLLVSVRALGVPEPSSAMLLGLGCLAFRSRFRR